jgi:hypothetical protein
MYLLLSIDSDAEIPIAISDWRRLEWMRGPEVRAVADPTDDQLSSALALLTRGEVLSVAFLEALPPVDRHWLAYEFWHKLVTDATFDGGRLEARGWRADPREEYTVWDPPPWVNVEHTEFAAGLLEPTKMTVEVSLDHDLADTDLFGPLAASQQGGSSALMALSGAQSARNTVILRNPAALDLELLTRSDSLPQLVAQGALSVSSVGGSSHTEASALDLKAFSDPDAARRAWASTNRPTGFWLVIQVTALVDPMVGIPPGHIFEQRGLNGVQTLAASASRSFVVGVGRPQTVVVPAWCLNQDLQPPTGQQVRSTPLRARYDAGTSQEAVWDHRRWLLSP